MDAVHDVLLDGSMPVADVWYPNEPCSCNEEAQKSSNYAHHRNTDTRF